MAVSVNNVRNVIEIVQRNKNSVKKFQLNFEKQEPGMLVHIFNNKIQQTYT